jgi:hypothetical protein
MDIAYHYGLAASLKLGCAHPFWAKFHPGTSGFFTFVEV